MKRSSLVLSTIGAAVLGGLAFSSTASAVPQDGPTVCNIVLTYCLYSGQSQAYCDAKYEECIWSGGSQYRPAAGKQARPTGDARKRPPASSTVSVLGMM